MLKPAAQNYYCTNRTKPHLAAHSAHAHDVMSELTEKSNQYGKPTALTYLILLFWRVWRVEEEIVTN